MESQGVSVESDADVAPARHAVAPATLTASGLVSGSSAEASLMLSAASVVIAAPRAPGIAQDDIVYTPYALSIGDGFKFGCGMVLALVVTSMVVVMLIALGVLLATMAGIQLPVGSVAQ